MKYLKTTLLIVCFTFASSLLYGQSIKYIPQDAELVVSIDYKTIMQKAGKNNIKRLLENTYMPYEVMAIIENSKSIGINPKDKIRVVLSSALDEKRYERYYAACIIPLQNATLFQNFIDNNLQDFSGIDFEAVEYENYKLIKFITKDYHEEYYSEDSVTIEEYDDEDTIIFADEDEESDDNYNDSNVCEICQNNSGYTQFYIAYNKDAAIIVTSENMAKNIFDQKQAFSSTEFESIQKEKHDVDLWMKSSFLFETMINDFYGSSDIDISKSLYIKDSVFTVTLDFLKGKAVMNMNQIMPNAPDMRKIVKKTDENIYKYFDDKSSLGFISISLNPDEYYAILEQDEFTQYIIKNMLGFSINMIAEEYGFEIKDIVEILSGDIFVSVSSDEKMSFYVSIGIRDEEKFEILFDKVLKEGVVIKDEENGVYIYQSGLSDPYALKYEDEILHITSVKNIYTKSSPVEKQPAHISNIANGNIVGLYVDLEKVINIFLLKHRGTTNGLNAYDNFTLKSNVIGASEIKTTLEINMKNKSKNSLETILNLINDTFR